jgi:hypothetical protein
LGDKDGGSNILHVVLENGDEEYIRPHTWEMTEYAHDKVEQKIRHKVIGTYTQYPVRLAFSSGAQPAFATITCTAPQVACENSAGTEFCAANAAACNASGDTLTCSSSQVKCHYGPDADHLVYSCDNSVQQCIARQNGSCQSNCTSDTGTAADS